jgi:hypothetical protein
MATEQLYNTFQYSVYGNLFIFGFRQPYDKAVEIAEDCARSCSADYGEKPTRMGDEWHLTLLRGGTSANVFIRPCNDDRRWEYVKAFESYFTPDELQQLKAVGVTTG